MTVTPQHPRFSQLPEHAFPRDFWRVLISASTSTAATPSTSFTTTPPAETGGVIDMACYNNLDIAVLGVGATNTNVEIYVSGIDAIWNPATPNAGVIGWLEVGLSVQNFVLRTASANSLDTLALAFPTSVNNTDVVGSEVGLAAGGAAVANVNGHRLYPIALDLTTTNTGTSLQAMPVPTRNYRFIKVQAVLPAVAPATSATVFVRRSRLIF